MVHLLYLKLLSILNQNIKKVRTAYFSDLITNNKHNPKFLFNTIDQLVNPAHPTVSASSPLDCESWLSSFLNKINIIRSNFNNPTVSTDSPVHCPTLLSDFSPISLHNLIVIISHMHLSSCTLDVMPPKFLKEVLPTLGPSLPSIINLSLTSCSVPDGFKMASIKPILKKPALDPTKTNNYRPISKLPFISKILGNILSQQLLEVIEEHDIFNKLQSGFRHLHSTETALLRVTDDAG